MIWETDFMGIEVTYCILKILLEDLETRDALIWCQIKPKQFRISCDPSMENKGNLAIDCFSIVTMLYCTVGNTLNTDKYWKSEKYRRAGQRRVRFLCMQGGVGGATDASWFAEVGLHSNKCKLFGTFHRTTKSPFCNAPVPHFSCLC